MSTISKNREQLIDECQGLVRSLALKIQKGLPRHLELDDLISYGQLGLAEAARDFDGARGGQFTTFAYYRIRGAIYDGVSKMSWVSRAQYHRVKYEQMANDALRLAAESDPAAQQTVEQGASWLTSMTSAMAMVYLSSHSGRDESSESMDVEDRRSASPETAAIDAETSRKVHQLIDELPEECRSLIRAAYFEGLTLTEAGQRLGIGKAWASRLHAKALGRLGRSLRQAGISD
jgi:RNA polymerase sigma factor for flagellar operon FliA